MLENDIKIDKIHQNIQYAFRHGKQFFVCKETKGKLFFNSIKPI